MRLRTKICLIFSLYIGLLAALAVGVTWRLNKGPIMLGSGSSLTSRLLSGVLRGYEVTWIAPRLVMEEGHVGFHVKQVQLMRQGSLQLLVNEVRLTPNLATFWLAQNIRLERVFAASVSLIDDRRLNPRLQAPPTITPQNFFPASMLGALGLVWDNFDSARDDGILRRFDSLEIYEVNLLTQNDIPQAGSGVNSYINIDKAQPLKDSTIRLDIDDQAVQFLARLAMGANDTENKFELQADYYFRSRMVDNKLVNAGGQLMLRMNNIRPNQYESLIPELPMLKDMDFAMDIVLQADLNANGRLNRGDIDGQVRSGIWRMPEQDLLIEKGELALDIDFIAQSVDIQRAEFVAGNNDFLFRGQAQYVHTADEFLQSIAAQLSSDAFTINVKGLSDAVIIGDEARFDFVYDLPRRRLRIEELRFDVKTGWASLSGEMHMQPKGDFLLRASAENMGISQLRTMRAFPLPVRNVINRFVKSGKIVSGAATIWRNHTAGRRMTWLPAPAHPAGHRRVQVEGELVYEEATIEWRPGLPHLEKTEGVFRLESQDLHIDIDHAMMRRPSHWAVDAIARPQDLLHITNGTFQMPSYRDKTASARLAFTYEGAARVVGELLQHPTLRLVGDYHYMAESVRGQLVGTMRLDFPNMRKFDRSTLRYEAEAQSNSMQALLYDGYQLRADYLRARSTAQGTVINGTAFLHEAKGQVNLFYNNARNDAEPYVVFNWIGPFGKQDFAALGWDALASRLDGIAQIDFSLQGFTNDTQSIRLDADLNTAILRPRPLAYTKDDGLPARLFIEFTRNGGGQIGDVQVDYTTDKDVVRGELRFDNQTGRLVSAKIDPMRLGNVYDGHIHLKPATANRLAQLEFGGAAFHLAGLSDLMAWIATKADADTLLDENMDMRADIKTLHGYDDIRFDTLQARAQRRLGRLAKLRLATAYDADRRIGIRLERETETQRRLQGMIGNLGELVRAMEDDSRLRRGELLWDMQLFDTPQTHPKTGEIYTMSGQARLQDFYVIDAPILTQLLSLASLTGILTSLRGDGIYFSELNTKFDAHAENKILHFSESMAAGPALSVTVDGVYDYAQQGQTRLQGTIVPANTVNILLRRIPLFGRLIAGREGDGVIGIRYSIADTPTGDTDIGVNPLTIFTPSILRRMLAFRP